MILLVDNYDSFSHNLVQAIEAQGGAVELRRNDDRELLQLDPGSYGGLLLGPGPGRPEAAGALMEVLARFYDRRPILGVCLGMQALALHHGAEVGMAPRPLHGRIESIHHDGQGLYSGLPSPLQATRYHSLCVLKPTLPPALKVTAYSEDQVIMGLRDERARAEGFQFHPESVASRQGPALIAAFLREVR